MGGKEPRLEMTLPASLGATVCLPPASSHGTRSLSLFPPTSHPEFSLSVIYSETDVHFPPGLALDFGMEI